MVQIIKPSVGVEFCPPGEYILSVLEQAARTCYKSEDKISKGLGCESCGGWDDTKGTGVMPIFCTDCNGTGWEKEPSSYGMIRDRILHIGAEEQKIKKAVKLVQEGMIDAATDLLMRPDPTHESVIEHMYVTARFICNRGISHEIVRHRLGAYSQESTRYVNYSKGKFGSQIKYIDNSWHLTPEQLAIERTLLPLIETAYMEMIRLGCTAQFARNILPIGLKTEIVVTYNLRQWRHVFRLRVSKKSHPQIRELMISLLKHLKYEIPIIFDDIYPQYKPEYEPEFFLPIGDVI